MALATIADYEAITGTTVPASPSPIRTRIQLLLDLSESAVLAGAHGQLIAEQTYTDVTLRPFEGVAYFPQRPVSDVASVAIVDSNGDETALTEGDDWRFEPGNGRPAKLIRRRFGRDDWWGNTAAEVGFGQVGSGATELKVTYTAGWDPIPGQLVGMQVAMVIGTMGSGGQPIASSHSETAGPFSETDTYEATEVRQANYALTPSDQVILNRLCKVKGHTSVPVAASAP